MPGLFTEPADVCIDQWLLVECWHPNGSAMWAAECSVQLQLSGRIQEWVFVIPLRSGTVPYGLNGRSFFSESCTRIWVIIMKPRHTNTSWKENRSLFKCILRCSHHLSLCPLAVFGCSETQNVSFSCEWFCFWCYYSHICSLFNGEIQSRHVADNNWVCQHVKI